MIPPALAGIALVAVVAFLASENDSAATRPPQGASPPPKRPSGRPKGKGNGSGGGKRPKAAAVRVTPAPPVDLEAPNPTLTPTTEGGPDDGGDATS